MSDDVYMSEYPSHGEVRAWLNERVLETVGLESFAPVWRRVGRDRRVEMIQNVWRAYIAPAFDPAAVVLMTREPERRRWSFATIHYRDAPLDRVTSVYSEGGELPAGGDDLIEAALSQTPMIEPISDIAVADGIGYELEFDIRSTKATVTFSNPRTQNALRLEAALLETLEAIRQQSTTPLISDYLQMLSPWTTRRRD